MSSHTSQAQLRRQISERLKAARHALGYTQNELALALGIGPARYSKYEIGRSEAPYDVLIKFANLTGMSLACLQSIPLAAVVFDHANRLVGHNRPYRETFFSRCPHVLRPGTPFPHLIRTWAYSEGHDLAETEDFVRQRVNYDPGHNKPVTFNIGATQLRIAESRHDNYRLVLITDVMRSTPAT
jgi:transcriptional regulator with XRE-family HTH domain